MLSPGTPAAYKAVVLLRPVTEIQKMCQTTTGVTALVGSSTARNASSRLSPQGRARTRARSPSRSLQGNNAAAAGVRENRYRSERNSAHKTRTGCCPNPSPERRRPPRAGIRRQIPMTAARVRECVTTVFSSQATGPEPARAAAARGCPWQAWRHRGRRTRLRAATVWVCPAHHPYKGSCPLQ